MLKMKFAILLAIVVIGFVLLFYFGGKQSSPPAGYSENPVVLQGIKPTSTKNSIPSGFRGPTGKPYIKGPSGPPPGY